MPDKKGPLKEIRINYQVPPRLLPKIESMRKNQGFSDNSELITVALQEYLNRKELEELINFKVKDFFESDEGKELFKKLLQYNSLNPYFIGKKAGEKVADKIFKK